MRIDFVENASATQGAAEKITIEIKSEVPCPVAAIKSIASLRECPYQNMAAKATATTRVPAIVAGATPNTSAVDNARDHQRR